MRHVAPAILWTALVLLASSEPFSAAHTGSILESIAAFVHLHLTPRQFDLLHFLIRKTAHLTEYGILGLLWFRALRHGAPPPWSWRRAAIAILIVAVVATADELHQSFVPQRTASPYDVMLDIAGATIAQCGLWLRMLLFVQS